MIFIMKSYLQICLTLAGVVLSSCGHPQNETQGDAGFAAELRLVDYRPVSVFKIPVSDIKQASFPVIDMHSHAYVNTVEDLQEWVKNMDENQIEKVVIHTGAYGEEFDAIYDLYKGVSDRFVLWCGIDMSSWGTPDFPRKAIEELERCWRKGAKGVGELSDKGLGEKLSRSVKEPGIHFNDDLLVPVFAKCAELGMPVNCHIGDPVWMYEDIDEHNDGFMNAAEWKIDLSQPGILDLYELVATMEEACSKNPETTFIACHFINIGHDYEFLGEVLERHPNLYIDNSARHLESSATPRATKKFYEKYSDRIIFGTDNTPEDMMYKLQWRILESDDEHFYYPGQTYHWPLHGLDLSDDVLKKIYKTNAVKILN